ncbi:DUF6779 domain-containing protein [Corynebacterium sp. A21]|uniref:DUF6779 domain-containing protein n=1 Tax=Corynebacterium sp. A21 TaxID=3457318 RepID=UPI003FD58558
MSAEKSEESPNVAIDRGQMLLIALVALALIASVIMLITDSNTALKLALIAALWAAVIGFFLVTRYRREAQRTEDQLKHERELHKSEVAKQEAEQQTHEAKFALDYQEKQRADEAETLVEIQQELAELRANLEALSGHEFGYEPAALRAQARRIMELESETGAGAQSRGAHIKGAPSSAAITGLLGQTPKEPLRREVPLAEPTTAETEVVETPEDIAEKAAAAKNTAAQETGGKVASRDDILAAVKSPEPIDTEPKRETDKKVGETPSTSETRTFNSGTFTAVKWDAVGDKHVADATPKRAAADSAATGQIAADKDAAAESAAAEKAAQNTAAQKAAEKAGEDDPVKDQDAEQRRGRRRRDERSDSLSVADLMANIRNDEN